MQLDQDALFKCNKCGSCTAVCPLYEQTLHEGMAARGKVATLEAVSDGRLQVTEAVRDRLGDCLLCGACKQKCPGSVPTTDLFLTARAEIVKERGLPLWAKAFLGALGSPALMGLGTRAGLVLQKMGGLGFAPPIAARPYRSRQLPTTPPEGARMKVAYFAGCIMNWVYADVAEATHRVLVHNGYHVEAPAVECCGMPNLGMGDREGARRLARHNIDVLSGFEAVVSDCASCGTALKAYGELLADDPAYAEKAKELAGRVFDVSEFLVKFGYKSPEGEVPVRVTYHESCHLGREQKVKQQPRQLLRSIPGVEFVEMKDADVCCGGGGSFLFTHPELAGKIGGSKAANIKATGSSIVATGCPECSMQIRMSLRNNGVKAEVRHPVQLLAESYGLVRTRPDGK